MKKLKLTTVCCLLQIFSIAQKIENQADAKFFYARWQHEEQVLQLGSFSKKMKKQPAAQPISIQNFDKRKLDEWLGEATDAAGGALIYVHCLWGSEPHFHRKSMQALRQILEQSGDRAPRTLIAVVWKSGDLNYSKNWAAAAEKGAALAPFVQVISEKFGGKVQVFSHSMGNRFWEGTASQFVENQKDKPLAHWLLFSPDLPSDWSDTEIYKFGKRGGASEEFLGEEKFLEEFIELLQPED